jgi:hypothetical protein
VPDHDSAVFEKLTEAGAVLMDKAGLQEFAYGITCNNPHFGPIRNPHDPDRIPGGSSGGSGVAVAKGMVFFAMGPDTGGSIRIPASFCGCVGLKPTSGRVSRFGVMPLDFSLDHMGPVHPSTGSFFVSAEGPYFSHSKKGDSITRNIPDFGCKFPTPAFIVSLARHERVPNPESIFPGCIFSRAGSTAPTRRVGFSDVACRVR